MKKEQGFTLVELLIVMAIIGIISAIAAGTVVNNRGATEKRALSGAQKFLDQNNIMPKRLTCAGDSDHDGYGTCNVLTDTGEKVVLNCPTDYLDVNLFGASSCKEVFMNYNLTMGQNQ